MRKPPRLVFAHDEVFTAKFTPTERVIIIIKTLQEAGLIPELDLANINTGEVLEFTTTLDAVYASISALGRTKSTSQNLH